MNIRALFSVISALVVSGSVYAGTIGTLSSWALTPDATNFSIVTATGSYETGLRARDPLLPAVYSVGGDNVPTFYVSAGSWRLDLSIAITPPPTIGDHIVTLFSDSDPSAGVSFNTDFLNVSVPGINGLSTYQASWDMSSFAAPGTYDFRLQVQSIVMNNDIRVVVAEVPDSGSTIILIGLGLIALALVSPKMSFCRA